MQTEHALSVMRLLFSVTTSYRVAKEAAARNPDLMTDTLSTVSPTRIICDIGILYHVNI